MTGPKIDPKMVPAVGGNDINLRKIVFTVYRRKWIILAVALPIIILGGLSLFSQSGSFTASSKVVVELVKVDLPQWNTTGRNVDYDRELSTMFNVAMSVPVLEAAAEDLEDSVMTILELDPMLQEALEDDNWLIGFLFDGLSVGIVGESRILDFQFNSTHPRISLMCVGALRDAFVGYTVHGEKNSGAISYYEEQIELVRAEIDSLLGVRAGTLEENGFISLKDELRYSSGQLAEMDNDLMKAETNRTTLEVEYNWLVAFLDGDPRDFPMGEDQSRSHSLINWRNLVSKQEEQLHATLSVYNAESLPVKRKEEILAKSLESLKREQVSYVASLETNLQFARSKETTLRRLLAAKKHSSAKMPEIYQRISLLDTEIESLRGLMEDLHGKWGEVRLNQLADERVSNVISLTNPELIVAFSGGKTMVYFAMVIFFGFALGIVVAFVMESMDHRVYVPIDVEDHLHLPVFASVSRK